MLLWPLFFKADKWPSCRSLCWMAQSFMLRGVRVESCWFKTHLRNLCIGGVRKHSFPQLVPKYLLVSRCFANDETGREYSQDRFSLQTFSVFFRYFRGRHAFYLPSVIFGDQSVFKSIRKVCNLANSGFQMGSLSFTFCWSLQLSMCERGCCHLHSANHPALIKRNVVLFNCDQV